MTTNDCRLCKTLMIFVFAGGMISGGGASHRNLWEYAVGVAIYFGVSFFVPEPKSAK